MCLGSGKNGKGGKDMILIRIPYRTKNRTIVVDKRAREQAEIASELTYIPLVIAEVSDVLP